MRGMILAAGLGTRIRTISETVPKPLLPVHGFPLIAYALGQLKAAGITEVVVNTHHFGEMVEKYLQPCADHGIRVAFSREVEPLETGGGIAAARQHIGQEPFVVLNADTICDIELRSVIAAHRDHGGAATMALREHPDPSAFSVVEWDESDGRIVDIRGTLNISTPTSRATLYTGVQVLDPVVFDYLHPVRTSIVDSFYLPALRDGQAICGHMTAGYWADIGTPERYDALIREFHPTNLKNFQPLPIAGPELS